MNTSEELANAISKILDEKLEEKMKVLEDTYFAKSKQTLFTKAELAEKWGCSKSTVAHILKDYHVEPVGKRGKEHEFEFEQAKEAKRNHDGEKLHRHELSWKMRAM